MYSQFVFESILDRLNGRKGNIFHRGVHGHYFGSRGENRVLRRGQFKVTIYGRLVKMVNTTITTDGKLLPIKHDPGHQMYFW